MTKYFDGFPREYIDFLWELRMNNNTEWFNENRERYDLLVKEPMKLFAAKETGEETSAAPGRVIRADKRGICVACGDGKVLCLTELQAPGGKRMSAASYLAGHPISLGDE